MSGIDPRYIPVTGGLQEFFVDKNAGSLINPTELPLSGGIVTFYKDQARTIPKSVWQLTGTPPNYTFSDMGNELTLSAVGTFQDLSGNDIVPFYFPYDANGNIELYYVVVTDSDSGAQFTRQGEPYSLSTSPLIPTNSSNLKNYIPNGQFRIHNDIVNDGLITSPETAIAPGGWYFMRPTGSTAVDYVTFQRYGSPITNPTGNARFACVVTCETPNPTDAYKYLPVRFNDVNTFASDANYNTISFGLQSLTGSSVSIDILSYKYFGAGGSPTLITPIKNIVVTTSMVQYSIPVQFGNNIGKTIGSNNDDYIQIVISMPTSYAFELLMTDAILYDGNIIVSQYPTTTISQDISLGLAGSIDIPNPNGSQLGFNPSLTTYGMAWKPNYPVGHYSYGSTPKRPYGYLLCDGEQYDKDEVNSEDLIPYSRLADYLWTPAINNYWYGSGYLYVTAEQNTLPNVKVTQNSNGATTAVADGAVPTTFTFSTLQAGTPSLPYIFNMLCVAATSITAGAYFTVYTPSGSNYVFWYRKAGLGTAPSVTTNKLVAIDITNTNTNNEVATLSLISINKQFFSVPDHQGLFPRVWNNGAGIDPDAATRIAPAVGTQAGDIVGTTQADQNLAHTHTSTIPAVAGYDHRGGPDGTIPSDTPTSYTTSSSGGAEARSKNYYVAEFISY